MDKKYAAATIALPAETVEMLDDIRLHLERETGILKLSRRQVIESLISQKMEMLEADIMFEIKPEKQTIRKLSRSEVDALGDADE